MLINPVFAQDQAGEEIDEVVVTGIRGSLKASMNVKRESVGVVDAINAEDIGKFPDTNLAESLQRISGVSIDRVNGEGSRITARGFGPGFNLVTLNGRAMPTADVVVVGSGGDGEYGTFTSRAFDMSNLASEGVQGIEVYKTGKASQPSGGIGATINVKTMRPLDAPAQASFGVKAMFDTSVETGSEVTPEASGLWSWKNDSENIGLSLFGSFQKRESASVGATNQDWNVERLSAFTNPMNGRVRADDPTTTGVNEATVFTNSPTGDPLIVFPNNSDYFFSEVERERVNGQLTLQIRPVDSLTLTFDTLFANQKAVETRSTQGNWFNRPFAQVTFDDVVGDVASVVILQESLSSPKDVAWGQQLRATKDVLQSSGFNAELAVSDRFTLEFDANVAKSQSLPDGPNGQTSYDFGTGTASIAAHSLDLSSGFPIQQYTYNDNDGAACNTVTRLGCRNDNGIIDIADVSSSVGRTTLQRQEQSLNEFRLEGDFAMSDSMNLRGGVDYRQSSMSQRRLVTAQVLGDWGVIRPGDIEALAPGVLEAYCLSCLYDDFSPGLGETAFRGNAAALYNAVSPYYLGLGAPIQTWNNDSNRVDEDITSAYAEWAWNSEVGNGRKMNLTVGARYEQTDVNAVSNLAIPSAVVWTADNDFAQRFANPNTQQLREEADYDHFLPSIDFSIEVVENLVLRASASKTIARADFGNMFNATTSGTPPRATALNATAGGGSGNPALVPLESTNLDFSAEWYYGDASYVSIGYFDKDVDNFIGTGIVPQQLFGLRDPSSGAPGTRSGQAVTLIGTAGAVTNDVNLFAFTAMVDNPMDARWGTNPVAYFQANSSGGILNQAIADAIFADYDILANSTDPLFTFQVATPINQESANINGIEFSFQHFFGESGLGIAGNYTKVDGDVAFNNAGNPGVDQFALLGLSDTMNATLIFEKFGFSARLAYNWRDQFLEGTNR
ncbi:MAG: TonB-dependent receptor, partial [Steroidobacteraceae bacterium]|nr:TonB-dependent receptor [Steroidobacteraceae bacterium]